MMFSRNRLNAQPRLECDFAAGRQVVAARRRRLAGPLVMTCLAMLGGELALAQTLPVRTIDPVVQGDEPIIVTKHKIDTPRGPLAYEARAGRLPIRNEQTGEVRGYMFFVAYHAVGRKENRPISFLWNGGPTAASWNFHTLGAGPRVRSEGGFVDNPVTLLADSDLVFMDAMETGFSRLAKPEFAPEFFQFQGDVASTVEFIRAYRTRFRANSQPLYIGGTSYGVFRAAAVVDELGQRGVPVAGALLISGDIPNISQPTEFYNAMHVPARTATAFFYKKLPPELMRDRAETMREALDWARNVYQPALARIAQLTDAEREAVALALARYTGVSPELVNRKTLVVPVNTYLAQFLGGDLTRPLSDIDTRISDGSEDVWAEGPLDAYMRGELQYTTDLTYRGIERGYMPTPGPPAKTTRQQFHYNQPGMTDEAMQDLIATGEVTKLAQLNPPWIVNALKRDKSLRVLVITGRYDPLNMCEGNEIVTATLPYDLARRIENRCYEAGHIVYRYDEQRAQLSRDFAKFVRESAIEK
ncbi:S10 family serine carboxypeptidase-like protein [Sphingopyxis sp. JAI128]|uniref:S10 family serine carboxypeptidase-like protein n=1 Tax=Sphingopyxis sp. JAI128 TaxID=2723066 RepID=UPI00161EECA0|nr:hypothetical protein [Sphingopyxis sp. JAI128]MBB6427904.1 hypothetical protein [Sphingopyxis sp. JAI128]